ncbi:hypothetical protein J6590_017661 [Homalodisca vitripennis]|nr:hypothetical protein J6590_017661 [Homalodisca vitripennis]
MMEQSNFFLWRLVQDTVNISTTNKTFTLDRGLTWDNYIDHACAEIASEIFALRNLAQYCSIRVFRLQKRTERMIFGLRARESCRDAFRSKCALFEGGFHHHGSRGNSITFESNNTEEMLSESCLLELVSD